MKVRTLPLSPVVVKPWASITPDGTPGRWMLPPWASITPDGTPGRWMLRLADGRDDITYRSDNVIRLREFANRYFHRPLEWTRNDTDGSLWAG